MLILVQVQPGEALLPEAVLLQSLLHHPGSLLHIHACCQQHLRHSHHAAKPLMTTCSRLVRPPCCMPCCCSWYSRSRGQGLLQQLAGPVQLVGAQPGSLCFRAVCLQSSSLAPAMTQLQLAMFQIDKHSRPDQQSCQRQGRSEQ